MINLGVMESFGRHNIKKSYNGSLWKTIYETLPYRELGMLSYSGCFGCMELFPSYQKQIACIYEKNAKIF